MTIAEFLENVTLVGVPEMDEQHQQYARLVKHVKLIEDGKYEHLTLMDVLQELIAFSQFHFLTEENLMIEYEYPDYKNHKHVHEDLMRNLHKSLRNIGKESFDIAEFYGFICDWVLEHTRGEDMKLGKFLSGKLQEQGQSG